MAAGPICIITSTGMICAASKPMKRHFPTYGNEPPKQGLDLIVDDVNQALVSHGVSGRDAITTVVQLMVQAGVDDHTAFSIYGSQFAKRRRKHGKKR